MDSFSIKDRWKSFAHALNGLKTVVIEEDNAKIHLVVALASVSLGLALDISLTSWCLVILSISLVWSMECINTCIENLCDDQTMEYNLTIKKTKDTAAGAVLVSAVAAFIIGLIVFVPPILNLLTRT